MIRRLAVTAAVLAADRTVITLDDDAYDAFLQALEAPPQVNEKLLKALRRPSSITWID